MNLIQSLDKISNHFFKPDLNILRDCDIFIEVGKRLYTLDTKTIIKPKVSRCINPIKQNSCLIEIAPIKKILRTLNINNCLSVRFYKNRK